jgi:hypothetical protein
VKDLVDDELEPEDGVALVGDITDFIGHMLLSIAQSLEELAEEEE